MPGSTDQNMQEMEKAAAAAEAELSDLPEEALRVVANWWNKWYPNAGHKRLGRIIIQYAEKKEEEHGG